MPTENTIPAQWAELARKAVLFDKLLVGLETAAAYIEEAQADFGLEDNGTLSDTRELITEANGGQP